MLHKKVVISIDAMGGDKAPAVVVDGLDLFIKKNKEVDFLLFGDEFALKKHLEDKAELRLKVKIIHTSDVISNNEKPSVALRNGRNSSMRLAINAVSNGEADVVVSAGNTGAFMAMSKFVLKLLPGVDRPCIATHMPVISIKSKRTHQILLDLGANVDCTPNNLVQFSILGKAYAKTVLGVENPEVALLNIGEEALKGNDIVRATNDILSSGNIPVNYIGYIEGNDILNGKADVIVTDGFTGNVALKVMEGVARGVVGQLKYALRSTFMAKFGAILAYSALKKIGIKLDPKRYNGAMFLGLKGVAVKSHGGTDALGFASALESAFTLVKNNLNEQIQKDFSELLVSEEKCKINQES